MKQGVALDKAGLTSSLEGVVYEKPLWIRKKLIWKNDRKAGFFVKMGRYLRIDTEKLMKFIGSNRVKVVR